MSRPENIEFHSATILDSQWDAFSEYATINYKPNSAIWSELSESQKLFVGNYLFIDEHEQLQENLVPHVNHFWIKQMRDSLAETFYIEAENAVRQMNADSIVSRKNHMDETIKRAYTFFKMLQDPNAVTRLNRSTQIGMKRFHSMVFDIEEVPFRLLLDIGRYLGFRKAVDSDSWRFAGRSYLLRLFCNQFCKDAYRAETPNFDENALEEDPENSDVFYEEQPTVDLTPGEIITHWSPCGKDAQRLRDCWFFTWTEYYQPDVDGMCICYVTLHVINTSMIL